MKVLVAGAGGFIGGHLVKRLVEDGHEVRAVDIKPAREWWQLHGSDNWLLDLRDPIACGDACDGVEWVYNLAADMGGIGYIETHKVDCMRSVLINTNLIDAAWSLGVERYLFTSSACVYPQALQEHHQSYDLTGNPHPGMPAKGPFPSANALKERDAYPADAEDGYGWEKLFSERMCRHYQEETEMETRVARLHNVYGPHGTWQGGREKAPAALCRKVAEAVRERSDEIEIWGDGEQTRSFMYVEDCIEGLLRIMDGDFPEPVNLGSAELVTINQLAGEVAHISGRQLEFKHIDGPLGVRGRNSDNTLIKKLYGWEPSTPLHNGLVSTYEWIAEQNRIAHGEPSKVFEGLPVGEGRGTDRTLG